MGLGKSLQSLCILAGKHHERAERFKATQSPDAVHLPSVIVCPSTLTGHWYYEVLKFTDTLRPMLYVGNSTERSTLVSKIAKHDVVVMSYEVVRNDISILRDIAWNYCILDEGHIIKNGKTKLTQAVKALRASHRLILSGTPIQNNVLELWSLFDFLMPGFLGTEKFFNERYGKPITADRDGKASAKEREAGMSDISSPPPCVNVLIQLLSFCSGSRTRGVAQAGTSFPPSATQGGCPARLAA